MPDGHSAMLTGTPGPCCPWVPSRRRVTPYRCAHTVHICMRPCAIIILSPARLLLAGRAYRRFGLLAKEVKHVTHLGSPIARSSSAFLTRKACTVIRRRIARVTRLRAYEHVLISVTRMPSPSEKDRTMAVDLKVDLTDGFRSESA